MKQKDYKIITHNGKRYKVIEEVVEPQQEKVLVNGWDVTEYEKWYNEKYCLEAVKNNGSALQYVDKRVFQ